MTMANKKIISTEATEYGVDARYDSQDESEKDAQILMEARRIRMSKLSKQDILRAKLVQLKIQIDEYLNSSEAGQAHQFTSFLNSYIRSIYERQQDFAHDLDITPVSLS